MTPFFHDRHDAGKQLAKKLAAWAERGDVVVLALPRGGVPVAFEVALRLHAPLDLMLVRKLGVPGQEELALGAVALPDICIFNHDVILTARISQQAIDKVVTRESMELQRRNQAYRGGAPAPNLKDRVVILVDDGIATGATMHAAISAVARQHPLRIIVAVPVAPQETCETLQTLADEVLCLHTPMPFFGVGRFYEDFSQTSDQEVMKLLEQARHWGKGHVHSSEEHNTPTLAYNHLVEKVRNHAIALTGNTANYTPLLQMVGDARFVLIGEATHGTEEFYRIRAEITKQLILSHGFAAVAVEADWPDAYRVNRYVRGDPGINNANSALAEFVRFPAWMWRNEAVMEFVDWLRDYNQAKILASKKVGFYGLDLYSLNASIKAVIDYLDRIDPPAAARARHYYGCFDNFYTQNPQDYGYASTMGLTRSCEHDVVKQLAALRQRAFDYIQHDGVPASEAFFCAEQNARLVVNAEEYYRSMFQNRVSSWNLRDQHMAETLEALATHLSAQREEPAKIVVWAHNSHIGDARATEMGERGEWNIGQLVRERHGDEARLIGFSTYDGTVTAASQWDGPAERKTVRPGMREGYEALFHDTGLKNFMLILRDDAELGKHLHLNRLQRAIGVLYLPQTELQSHYFYSRLAQQFDAVIHVDRTTALQPLETVGLWHKGEAFETYPAGF